MNYARHRKYHVELKKLMDRNSEKLSKLSGQKRHDFELSLKELANKASSGKPVKKSAPKAPQTPAPVDPPAPKDPVDPNTLIDLTEEELQEKNVEELKAYASERNIDLGAASSVNGLIKKIRANKKAE